MKSGFRYPVIRSGWYFVQCRQCQAHRPIGRPQNQAGARYLYAQASDWAERHVCAARLPKEQV